MASLEETRDETTAAVEARRRDRRALIAILCGFAMLAGAYGIVVPVFDAPDETHHFEYVRHLAEDGRLPDQTDPERTTSIQGFKSPLYYGVAALVLSALSSDNAADLIVPDYADLSRYRERPLPAAAQPWLPPLNPRYLKWGRGAEANMFLRADADRLPYSGSLRAFHLLRLLNIPFGLLTIVLVFATTRLLFPDDGELSLAAAAICAFNPQFTFLHGYLNNDALVTAFAALSLWLLTRLVLSAGRDDRSLIALGAAVGLGLLTKMNSAFLLPIAALGIWLRPSLRGLGAAPRIRDLLLFGAPLAVVSGWYFLRSVSIYGPGDPLGWELLASRYPELVLPAELRGRFFREVFALRLFTSYWGRFDWLTIWLPTWSYWVYGLLSLTGLVGILAWVHAIRAQTLSAGHRLCCLLYLAAVGLAFASLVSLNFSFASAQGRLLFPVMTPTCLFIALGLRAAFPGRSRPGEASRRRAVLVLVALLAASNLYALLGVVAPVYR